MKALGEILLTWKFQECHNVYEGITHVIEYPTKEFILFISNYGTIKNTNNKELYYVIKIQGKAVVSNFQSPSLFFIYCTVYSSCIPYTFRYISFIRQKKKLYNKGGAFLDSFFVVVAIFYVRFSIHKKVSSNKNSYLMTKCGQ